jgi:hypothetical protein
MPGLIEALMICRMPGTIQQLLARLISRLCRQDATDRAPGRNSYLYGLGEGSKIWIPLLIWRIRQWAPLRNCRFRNCCDGHREDILHISSLCTRRFASIYQCHLSIGEYFIGLLISSKYTMSRWFLNSWAWYISCTRFILHQRGMSSQMIRGKETTDSTRYYTFNMHVDYNFIVAGLAAAGYRRFLRSLYNR